MGGAGKGVMWCVGCRAGAVVGGRHASVWSCSNVIVSVVWECCCSGVSHPQVCVAGGRCVVGGVRVGKVMGRR